MLRMHLENRLMRLTDTFRFDIVCIYNLIVFFFGR